MEILGHGVDVVSISRLREVLSRQTEHFYERVFSAEEISYCRSKRDPVPHFAARFAAKEAFGKALGLGLAAAHALSEVGVVHGSGGKPEFHFGPAAAQVFENLGGKRCLLSLSHDGDAAMASVIIWGISQ